MRLSPFASPAANQRCDRASSRRTILVSVNRLSVNHQQMTAISVSFGKWCVRQYSYAHMLIGTSKSFLAHTYIFAIHADRGKTLGTSDSPRVRSICSASSTVRYGTVRTVLGTCTNRFRPYAFKANHFRYVDTPYNTVPTTCMISGSRLMELWLDHIIHLPVSIQRGFTTTCSVVVHKTAAPDGASSGNLSRRNEQTASLFLCAPPLHVGFLPINALFRSPPENVYDLDLFSSESWSAEVSFGKPACPGQAFSWNSCWSCCRERPWMWRPCISVEPSSRWSSRYAQRQHRISDSSSPLGYCLIHCSLVDDVQQVGSMLNTKSKSRAWIQW